MDLPMLRLRLRIGLTLLIAVGAMLLPRVERVTAAPSIIATISFGSSRAGVIASNETTKQVFAAQEDVPAVAQITGVAIMATTPSSGFHSGITVDPATDLVYLAQAFAGTVRVIKGSTATTLADVPVPGLIHTVGHLVINPVTKKLYVVRANNMDIVVYDASTTPPTPTGAVIPLGGPCCTAFLAVDERANKVYASVRDANTVLEISGATDTVTRIVSVAGSPGRLAASPVTGKVYVPITSPGQVAVIAGGTVSYIPTAPDPSFVAVNAQTNRVYVGHGSGTHQVTVINGATGVVSGFVPVFANVDGGLTVLANQNRVYASVANSVVVIEDLSGGPWPMFGHDSTHTGRGAMTGPTAPAVLWTYALGVAARDNASPVVAADGTIYVPTDRAFFAINPNGTLKWKKQDFFSYLTRQAPAIAADGTVYVHLGAFQSEGLAALNPATGATLWTYPTGRATYGSPTIGPDGTIYIGNAPGFSNSSMFAINPNGTLKWRWDSGSRCWIESSPALGPSGHLYFHHNCLGLVALDAATGARQWALAGAGDAWNSPSVGPDGTIYIGDSPGFRAINPNGTDKWTAPTLNWMYKAAATISADGASIYRGDNGGIFYAFTAGGSVRWRHDTGIRGGITASPTLAANDILYFTQGWSSAVPSTARGHLFAVNAVTGALVWKHEVGWSSASPTLGSSGILYTLGSDATGKSVLYAFAATAP